MFFCCCFFFKQKTAYDMRISDWSSDVCSSDLLSSQQRSFTRFLIEEQRAGHVNPELRLLIEVVARACKRISVAVGKGALGGVLGDAEGGRSEEHTSELQSLMRISYAVFCLKKKRCRPPFTTHPQRREWR